MNARNTNRMVAFIVMFLLVFLTVFSRKIIIKASELSIISATVKISVCGNAIIEGGEDCEGLDLNSQTCETLGYAYGTLSCDISCAFDTSLCVSPTPTPTPTITPTFTPTPTLSITPTSAPTNTPTPGNTNTPTPGSNSSNNTDSTKTISEEVTEIISQIQAIPRFLLPYDPDNNGTISTYELRTSISKWVDSWTNYIDTVLVKRRVISRSNLICDLNADIICNLIDFSILLHYTGN